MPSPSSVTAVSRAALSYGAALGLRDASVLTKRLYDYGRCPVSPRLRRAFPTPEAVRDHLLQGHEPVRRLMASEWRRRALSGEDPGWALWTRPREDPRSGAASHKLYVSPGFEAIQPVFHTVIETITDSDAVAFKVGAELAYLARPDKLVIYFSGREETLRVGRLLAPALAGFPAHGVPFTGPVDEGGLLSWGMDPPHTSGSQRSWRVWLAERMAHAMAEAPPGEQLGAALSCVESLGVDAVTFEPRNVVWAGDGSD